MKFDENWRKTKEKTKITAEALPSSKKTGGTKSEKPKQLYKLPQQGGFKNNPELGKAAAIKGGKACVSTKHYTKCRDCDFNKSCPERYKEAEKNRAKGKRLLELDPESKNAAKLFNFQDDESRCTFELDVRKTEKSDLMRDYKAFVSFAPENTLEKLHMLFKKLENCVDGDSSYTKLASLFYMMMNIYKMKFGKDSPQVAVQINNGGNPSVDIKAIMKEMRTLNDNKPDVVDKDVVTLDIGHTDADESTEEKKEIIELNPNNNDEDEETGTVP